MSRHPVLLTLILLAPVAACNRDRTVYIRTGRPTAVDDTARSAAGPPAFVGRWALDAGACGNAAWVMSSNRLQSPGALNCALDKVTPTPAGYTIDGLCSSGGAGMPGRITATFSGVAGSVSMTLEGGPFPTPVGLIRCSGNSQVAASAPSGAPARDAN